MAVDMTYVATRRLRVGGENREPGELVPEAATWKNVDAYISTGRITRVPRSQVNQEELQAAEQRFEEVIRANRERADDQSEEDEGLEQVAATPAQESEGETAPQSQPDGEDETGAKEGDEPEVEARDYNSLNADEVRGLVEAGKLDPDQALEAELNRDKPRKGVLDFLEGQSEE